MVDPVIVADGHTYERGPIEQWLQGQATSYVTSLPLAPVSLPNLPLPTTSPSSLSAHEADLQTFEA